MPQATKSEVPIFSRELEIAFDLYIPSILNIDPIFWLGLVNIKMLNHGLQ
jgi:hypothetical protein